MSLVSLSKNNQLPPIGHVSLRIDSATKHLVGKHSTGHEFNVSSQEDTVKLTQLEFDALSAASGLTVGTKYEINELHRGDTNIGANLSLAGRIIVEAVSKRTFSNKAVLYNNVPDYFSLQTASEYSAFNYQPSYSQWPAQIIWAGKTYTKTVISPLGAPESMYLTVGNNIELNPTVYSVLAENGADLNGNAINAKFDITIYGGVIVQRSDANGNDASIALGDYYALGSSFSVLCNHVELFPWGNPKFSVVKIDNGKIHRNLFTNGFNGMNNCSISEFVSFISRPEPAPDVVIAQYVRLNDCKNVVYNPDYLQWMQDESGVPTYFQVIASNTEGRIGFTANYKMRLKPFAQKTNGGFSSVSGISNDLRSVVTRSETNIEGICSDASDADNPEIGFVSDLILWTPGDLFVWKTDKGFTVQSIVVKAESKIDGLINNVQKTKSVTFTAFSNPLTFTQSVNVFMSGGASATIKPNGKDFVLFQVVKNLANQYRFYEIFRHIE